MSDKGGKLNNISILNMKHRYVTVPYIGTNKLRQQKVGGKEIV
jgi:cytoplasmic iron level regulating protein YaaA (DUF328/UPF0246 family)